MNDEPEPKDSPHRADESGEHLPQDDPDELAKQWHQGACEDFEPASDVNSLEDQTGGEQ